MNIENELLAKKQVDVGKAVRLMETMEKNGARDTELFRIRMYLLAIKALDPYNEYLYNRKRDQAYDGYEIKELERKYGGNE